MPNDMLLKRAQDMRLKRERALEKIAIAARPIVAVLQDHNLGNTARALNEALFEFDAAEGDLQKLVAADPQAFIMAMLEQMDKGQK